MLDRMLKLAIVLAVIVAMGACCCQRSPSTTPEQPAQPAQPNQGTGSSVPGGLGTPPGPIIIVNISETNSNGNHWKIGPLPAQAVSAGGDRFLNLGFFYHVKRFKVFPEGGTGYRKGTHLTAKFSDAITESILTIDVAPADTFIFRLDGQDLYPVDRAEVNSLRMELTGSLVEMTATYIEGTSIKSGPVTKVELQAVVPN